MPYTKELYEKAIEIINNRRREAERKHSEKTASFEKEVPEYRELKNEMINSVRDALKSIDMPSENVKEFLQLQKMRNLTAQQEIARIIKEKGYPENYLEIKYYCPVCEDTGFYDSKLCECHIKILKELAYEEAGKKSPLKFCRFEDFRLDYYSEERDKHFDCSPKEVMTAILDFCKEYASSFDTSSQSVFMQGETGLGKTHLSLAIAGEVISKGYNVLYNSAQNIFNELQKERFGKTDTNGAYEAMVLECDLLVIDDLGAEFSTQFTNAALYNIINTRINTGLPTIISTNLSLSQIESAYTKKISSRIIGEYAHLYFTGNDIRQIKSEIQ